MNWIKGAKEHHGLHLDYIGVWNERPVSPEYVKVLSLFFCFFFHHSNYFFYFIIFQGCFFDCFLFLI